MSRLVNPSAAGLTRGCTAAIRALRAPASVAAIASIRFINNSPQHQPRSARLHVPSLGLRVRSRLHQPRHPSLSNKRFLSSSRPLARRWRTMWHKAGCRWVTSTEDPKTAPRDKDCPACQEEAGFPYELSRKELIWERQFRDMKEMLNKDPYEALFGESNRRLAQTPWLGMPFRDSSWFGVLRRPRDPFAPSKSDPEAASRTPYEASKDHEPENPMISEVVNPTSINQAQHQASSGTSQSRNAPSVKANENMTPPPAAKYHEPENPMITELITWLSERNSVGQKSKEPISKTKTSEQLDDKYTYQPSRDQEPENPMITELINWLSERNSTNQGSKEPSTNESTSSTSNAKVPGQSFRDKEPENPMITELIRSLKVFSQSRFAQQPSREPPYQPSKEPENPMITELIRSLSVANSRGRSIHDLPCHPSGEPENPMISELVRSLKAFSQSRYASQPSRGPPYQPTSEPENPMISELLRSLSAAQSTGQNAREPTPPSENASQPSHQKVKYQEPENPWISELVKSAPSSKSSVQASSSSQTTWEAYTPANGNGVFKWNTSGVNGGQPFNSSGEWEFDPVTMRRVPKKFKTPESVTSVATVTESVPISVKKWEDPKNAVANLESKNKGSVSTIPREAVPKNSAQSSGDTVKTAANFDPTRGDLKDTKVLLEESWQKDPSSKDPISHGSQKEKVNTTEEILPTSTKEMQAQRRASQFRYAASRWKELPNDQKNSNINARRSIFRKVRPLNQMQLKEFLTHRRALLDSLEARKMKKPEPSIFDKQLAKEIEIQKSAMAAMENKPRADRANSADTKFFELLAKNETSSPAQAQQTPIPGEGDLCLNAPNFVNSERWYKKKAPHAVQPEQPKLSAEQELARDVREIYENRYGKIDENHSQVETAENDGSMQKLEQLRDNWLSVLDFKRQQVIDQPSGQQSEEAKAKLLAIIKEGRQQLLSLFSEAKEKGHTPLHLKDAMTRMRTQIKNRLLSAKNKLIEPELAAKTPKPAEAKHDTPIGRSHGPVPIQSSLDRLAASEQKTKNDRDLYKVLAWDRESNKMYEAPASSSFIPPTEEVVLPLADAIMRLQHPAKYLPYFEKIEKEGYEIVSAGKHVLVFKRNKNSIAVNRDEVPQRTSGADSLDLPKPTRGMSKPSRQHVNPIDGTHAYPTPQTGNFASPTGFVNHDVFPGPEPTKPTSKTVKPGTNSASSKTTVSRHEHVFSGNPSHHWARESSISEDSLSPHAYINRLRKASKFRARYSDNRPRRRRFVRVLRTVRRLLLIGAWAAACCYATGVVIEYFRNGPHDSTPATIEEGESSHVGERREWADTRGVGQSGYFWQGSRPNTGSTAPNAQQRPQSRPSSIDERR